MQIAEFFLSPRDPVSQLGLANESLRPTTNAGANGHFGRGLCDKTAREVGGWGRWLGSQEDG